MENISCGSGHKYGVWGIEGNNAYRKCKCCNHIELLPKDIDILNEIEKQNEKFNENMLVERIVTSFLNRSIDDNNIIYFLNLILEIIPDFFKYSENELLQKNFLIRLEEIKSLPYLEVESSNIIDEIIKSLKNNDISTFYDKQDLFVNFNCGVSYIEQANVCYGK